MFVNVSVFSSLILVSITLNKSLVLFTYAYFFIVGNCRIDMLSRHPSTIEEEIKVLSQQKLRLNPYHFSSLPKYPLRLWFLLFIVSQWFKYRIRQSELFSRI